LLAFSSAARASTLYVTPGGAGARDGSGWENAFAGIQAAVDAVDAAWVAAQAAGDAYEIPQILVGDGTYPRVEVTNDIALDVRSVNGAAGTVIDGGGTNNCVCVHVGYANKTTPKFTGFTLRNGDTSGIEDWWLQDGGGAAGGTLVDCIIEDCKAYSGGGTYYTDTLRCVIRRCTATGWGGGGVYYGTHRNTLVHDCSTYVAAIYNANLYSCTVADTAAESDYYDVCYNSSRYNCIFWGNLVEGAWAGGNDAEDPMLVGGGDYRPRAVSPCIDGGDDFFAGEEYVGTTDIAGNARVQGAAIDRGCYEGPGVEGWLVTASADGNGTVSPARVFTNEGATVTIAADTSVFGRAVVQWTTNGATAAWGGDSLTLAPLAGDVVVTARFERIDWYVDAANGDDSAVGYESSTPFKTIPRALAAAAPGETIWVMPGVYPPIDTTGRAVNIAAAGEASETVIDGGGKKRCALLSDDTTLTGFTLRNGFFTSGNASDGGAGAKGGTLVECVLVDNIATYGGGAYGSTLVRCTVTDNCAGDGGGLLSCNAYDSFIGFNFGNQGGGARNSDLRFCTVVRNRGLVHGGADGGSACNCVFALNRSANNRPSYSIGRYEGNCFDVPNLYDENGEWHDGSSFTADPLFVDPENGDWRLRAASPCIDRGDAANAFDADGTDFAGNARVQGAAPDLGAWEGGVEGLVVSVRVDGHGSVSRSTFIVEEGDDVAVAAIEDGRPFAKWLVDGEDAGSGLALDLQNVTEDHVVTACFERRTTEVSGGGAALQAAIDAAADGDTLLVAAGTYSAINAAGRVLDIVGADGPGATVLQGAKTSMLAGTRAATFGATMTRPTCSLSGFTIAGGYCVDYTRGGGGVFGGNISNCIVRGNEAVLGGGASYATLTHCRVEGNTAHLVGGGTTMCVLDNCLVTGNTVADSMRPMIKAYAQTSLGFTLPDSFAGGGGIAYSAADHCTVSGNAAQSATAGGGYWVVLDNTCMAGNETTLDGGRRDIHKSRVAPLHVCSTENDGWGAAAVGFVDAAEDDTFVDAANGDFRLKAASLCIDGADASFPEAAEGTDLDGNPRWRAKAPDIGCYEAGSIAPDAVTAVSATRSDARTDVLVEWERSRGAEGYAVMRSATDDIADAVQIGTADNFASSFIDGTAAFATPYRYWVVPSSAAGGAAAAASDRGYWTTPLVLTTDALPDGDSPYYGDLAATGGIGPCGWSVTAPSYEFATNDACTFTTEGVTVVPYEGYYDAAPLMNQWLKNAMPLPFGFPYGGRVYTNVWIHSDGLVAFGENHPDWDDDPYNLNWEGTAFRVTEEQFLQVPAIAVYTHCSYDMLGTIFTDESATIIWEGQVWNDGWGSHVRFGLTLHPDGTFAFKYDTYGNPCLSEPLARYGYSTGDGEGFLARIGEGVSLASAPDRLVRFAPAPSWMGAMSAEPAGGGQPGAAAGILFASPPETVTNDVLVAVTDADGRLSRRRYRFVVRSDGSFAGFDVALDPRGGSGGTESVTAAFGEAMPEITVPTREGCVFGGYWTEENGGGVQYYAADGSGVRNWDIAAGATLYAHWTADAEPLTVWRFYSKKYRGHFFTIDEAEKQTLIDTNPNWKFEGGAYKAYTNQAPGTVPLYRFYSKKYSGHFFTIDEEEMKTVRDTNPNWKYEGIAYYVYPEEVVGTVPVFRFWSKGYKHHFYTIDEEEKDTLIATNPNWAYERIAFYALPLPAEGGKAARSAAESVPATGKKAGGAVGAGVAVTTSDGSDGSAVADGDETTGWSPETVDGSWVVLSFAEARDAADVEVAGENLPEGTRILISEDADEWQEGVPGVARYVWVAFPAAEEAPVVREIRVLEE
jgi:hypothetical protein